MNAKMPEGEKVNFAVIHYSLMKPFDILNEIPTEEGMLDPGGMIIVENDDSESEVLRRICLLLSVDMNELDVDKMWNDGSGFWVDSKDGTKRIGFFEPPNLRVCYD